MKPRGSGACVFCDANLQDTRRTWPNGQPRLLGHPAPDAVQLTVLLIQSGRTANMTCCADCGAADKSPDQLRAAWQRCVALSAEQFSDEYRKSHQMQPLEPERRHQLAVTLALQLSDLPVGVLAERRWEDVSLDRLA